MTFLSNQRFTPFGLLQNPYHRCTESYADRQGGILCAHDQYLSFGWRYPVGRNPLQEVSMGLGLIEQDKILVTREDLVSYHPYSRHHSAHLFSYEIGTRQGFLSCLYYLSQQDELVCQVQLDGFRAFVFWTIGTPKIQIEPLEYGWIYQGDQVIPLHSLQANVGLGAVVQNLPPGLVGREVEASSFEMVMARHSPPDLSPDASGRRRRKLAQLMQADMDFQRKCPSLIGDFPPHWQRGMIYDFETTRMCLFPPAGIFTDVWPTWMLSWPRAVLAEGALDMNRLGYADPDLAQRAILSLLRDTPGDNVPCVFASGGFNMVAEDGSICGTSPAWCLPFYNIYLLYLRTRNKDWLRQLYPYLSAYITWWLEERVDEDGWLVYKCTWESGEDNNPRIDPERKGNTIASGVIRPVELQAAMAHSCYIMEYFAEEIGKPHDQGNWRRIRRQYTEYVQSLWDENAGRFRDYDKRTKDFLESPGTEDYWGSDAIRFSALSLIPALFDTATPHQRERLREEIALYNRKPYIEWPSWTFVLLEAAVACGMYNFTAEVAAQICERVYNENDRRTLDQCKRPQPGCAREYWPLDLNEFRGNDAYAWGATTATLVIRQILGIRESDGGFTLCPGLPSSLMGRVFGLRNLWIAQVRTTVVYHRLGPCLLTTLQFDDVVEVKVQRGEQVIYTGYGTSHSFELSQYVPYEVRLMIKDESAAER